jgi:hypothetical protein
MLDNKILPMALIAALVMAGCASSERDPTAATTVSKAAGKWTKATEDEVAEKLGKDLFSAVKGMVFLKKDGELRFCKRSKDIGSSISSIKCITEAQVRTQVENNETYREQMRHKMGKCTLGNQNAGGACGGQ